MKKQNVVYIRVLLIVLSIVILLAFINRSPQNRHHDTWLPSSFNPVGEGNMAFYQTLEDLHWPVDRWREPLSRLSTFGTGTAGTAVATSTGVSEGMGAPLGCVERETKVTRTRAVPWP